MPAFWLVGEEAAPGVFVVEDEFTVRSGGRTVERTVFSNGHSRVHFDIEPETYFTKTRNPRFLEPGETRVVVPYTIRHPEVEAGVPADAEWVEIDDGRYGYWNLLRDYWQPENDLTLIEHDVQARPGIFCVFATCPEPWCYFRYSNHTDENAAAWHWGILGCTRFRKELIADNPDVVLNLEERWRDWHEMSTGLGKALRAAGYAPHVHSPAVTHPIFRAGEVAA